MIEFISLVLGALIAFTGIYLREKVKHINKKVAIYSRVEAHLTYWISILTDDNQLFNILAFSMVLAKKENELILERKFNELIKHREELKDEIEKKVTEDSEDNKQIYLSITKRINEFSNEEFENILYEIEKYRDGLDNGRLFIELKEINELDNSVQYSIIRIHNSIYSFISDLRQFLIEIRFSKKKEQNDIVKSIYGLILTAINGMKNIDSLIERCRRERQKGVIERIFNL